jgi:TRAP-type C4-dicarboxylate transport system substrate-binding protein
MFTITRITTAVAMIAVAVAAGTSLAGPPANGDKVTLTLETPSGPARPASNLADAFATRVKTLSNGSMTVKVVYGEAPSPDRTWPWLRTHLNNVQTNKVQLATAWGASMELAGIKTVRALHIPFQLTSKPAAEKATTGAIATTIMNGFGGSGLTGLALVPQGFSRIYAARKPLANVADFKGATIRTPYGPTSVTALKALGARPIDRGGGNFTDALAKGTITANEINWEIGSGYLATSKTAGNVALYPLTDVLVANTGAFNRLAASQQAILRRAAAEARGTMLSRWNEPAAARAFCKAGGTITNTTPANLNALRAKTASLTSAYTTDGATATAVAAIRKIRATTQGAVATCSGSIAEPSPTPKPSAGLLPTGVYRKSVTEQQLIAEGAPPTGAVENAGVWTLTTTADGYFKMSHTGPSPGSPCARRKMYLKKGLVVLEFRGGCTGTVAVAWESRGDGFAITRMAPEDWGRAVLVGTWNRVS